MGVDIASSVFACWGYRFHKGGGMTRATVEMSFPERNAMIVELAKQPEYSYARIMRHLEEKYGIVITRARVYQIVKRAGVVRPRKSGDGHHQWKGDRFVDKRGRVCIRDKDGNPVLESHVILDNLGREVKADEYVWHIDGDLKNLDPHNLEVIDNRTYMERTGVYYSFEGLFRLYRWLARHIGHTPTAPEIRKLSPVSAGVYYTHVSSLRDLAEKARLEPTGPGKFAPALPEGWLEDNEDLAVYKTAAGALWGRRGE